MAEEDAADLQPQEQLFAAAATGDVSAMKRLLEARAELGIDINAKDDDGMTALIRAITEGYLGVIYPLLEADAVTGDAMLKAVDADFHEAVRVLIEYADTKSESERMDIINCHSRCNDTHPVVTPIIRAGQLNSYAITKMLLEAGLVIPEMSPEVFENHEDDGEEVDDLQRSVGTLEIYGGLASDAYVCLASTDPIDRAFTLCTTMEKIAGYEVEFKVRYLELASRMEHLAADLVSYARDTEEITTVLTFEDSTTDSSSNEPHRRKGALPKVTKAIRCGHRRFIAHPNTQQSVSAQFYRHLAHLRDKPAIVNLLVFVGILLAFPFLSVFYKFGISTRVRTFVRTPYVKFVMHVASDISILILLPLIDTTSHFSASFALGQIVLHIILFLFVLGFGWRELFLCYVEGPKKIVTSFPHFRDIIITFLLLSYYALTLTGLTMTDPCTGESILGRSLRQETTNSTTNYDSAQLLIDDFNNHMEEIIRVEFADIDTSLKIQTDLVDKVVAEFTCMEAKLLSESDTFSTTILPVSESDSCSVVSRSWNDPVLIANSLFAIVNVLAFTRILPILIANEFVGQLVISVGDMVVKTSSFFIFVIAVIVSFSASLTFNFAFYTNRAQKECEDQLGPPGCEHEEYFFQNMGQSMLTLYWSLFGLISTTAVTEVADDYPIVTGAGSILFGFFILFVVLVLLNALIAVMSNVFNKVEENADVEWKFSRTQLWMSFLDDTVTVPPPFNLLPNFSILKTRVKSWWRFCSRESKSVFKKKENNDNIVMEFDTLPKRHRTYKQVDLGNYQRIMRRLVERYIAERTAQESSAQGDITIADIRNLRNDLIALRYDTFKQLCNMNEELNTTERQSSTINTQSTQANAVFKKTAEIDDELGAYKKRLGEVQNELAEKLKILPAIEELLNMLLSMNLTGAAGVGVGVGVVHSDDSEGDGSAGGGGGGGGGGQRGFGKTVQEMVNYYEHVKTMIEETKHATVMRQSSLTRNPGLTLTLENEEDHDTSL